MSISKLMKMKSDLGNREIAYYHDTFQEGKSSILWLSGYASTMDSTKANAIAEWATNNQMEMIRFDYSGLGKSSGEFAKSNLSTWLEEAAQIYQKIHNRPTLIIGSSMGAWLALLLSRYISNNNLVQPQSLLLLAPAVDFTHEVLLKKLSNNQLKFLKSNQLIEIPSLYSSEPLKIYDQFIENSAQHLLFNKNISFQIPITIIHGKQDSDIPIELAYKTQKQFTVDNFITVEDGEHRLSRDCDIQLILETIQNITSLNYN